MSFKHTCPGCEAKDKVVKRCRVCYSLMCSECSKHALCTDCYTSIEDESEIKAYFDDKYKNLREEDEIMHELILEVLPDAC